MSIGRKIPVFRGFWGMNYAGVMLCLRPRRRAPMTPTHSLQFRQRVTSFSVFVSRSGDQSRRWESKVSGIGANIIF